MPLNGKVAIVTGPAGAPFFLGTCRARCRLYGTEGQQNRPFSIQQI